MLGPTAVSHLAWDIIVAMTPAIPPPPIPAAIRLAERGPRLGAALVDGLIGAAVSLLVITLVIGFRRHMELSAEHPYLMAAIGAPVGYALFLLVHGKFLAASGQTIGKKLVGLRIARPDGSQPSLSQFAIRYLYFFLPVLPVVGYLLGIINILAIFRDSRRCFHDDVAGTVVVVAS
jgi:uncharacterized RDD family membrane protein YckC